MKRLGKILAGALMTLALAVTVNLASSRPAAALDETNCNNFQGQAGRQECLNTLYAGDPKYQACIGSGGTWANNTCNASGGKNLFGPGSFFVSVLNTFIFLIGAVAILMIIIGGLRYVLSGGDSAGTKSAKDTILYAIVGLIVAFLAYAAVLFVQNAITAQPTQDNTTRTDTLNN